MKMILKAVAILFISSHCIAQENIFYSSDFWKTNPSLNQVKNLIEEGNDPVMLNDNGFDATVYAIIRKANNDIITYLLAMEGNHPNKKTHDSRNYLHWAAYAGNVTIVNELLKAGASITQLDSNGNTPLTFAANAGVKDLKIYKAFKNNGVDLKKEHNEDGASVLLLVAAHLETENELNEFLTLGLEFKKEDNDGNNIFHYAARKGNIPFLKLLIEKGIDHKAKNKKGGNAILMASRGARGHQNSLEVYKFLESQGIEVNTIGDYGRNPLHAIAFKTDNINLLDYFINRGVDVNLQDDGGDTPFMNAANSNQLEIVAYLFKNVKNMNTQDETGKTALTMAINRNTANVAAFLLKNNANSKVIDKKGNSLAYYLINSFSVKNMSEFEEKLDLLKAQNVSMTSIQKQGNTLYHLAVLKGNLDLVHLLADFDIDINVKNDEGLTALHLAAMKAKDDAIIKYLISKGADLNIKTDFEESVYDLASENENLQNNNTSLNFLK